MPIKIRYNNDVTQECMIRPTPFISINTEVQQNKEGKFGVVYNITLTGTLLADHGMPYAEDPLTPGQNFPDMGGNPLGDRGPYNSFDGIGISSRDKPPRQRVNKPAAAILSKQRALRALFARDGQLVELSDIFDHGATVWCNPRVQSINFTEGQYITKCDYTINLQADVLMRGSVDAAGAVDADAAVSYNLVNRDDPDAGYDDPYETQTTITLDQLLDPDQNEFAAFIETYSENWALEADDSQTEAADQPISYRITHTLNATGKKVYNHDGTTGTEAWEEARKFVQNRLADIGPSGLSYPNIAGQIGSGTLNLAESYGGYNQVRTETIDVTAGSYSVTENFLLSSGTVRETFNMSTSLSNSDPFITVQLDGSIKGLAKIPASGYAGSKNNLDPVALAASGAYAQALDKYNQITNSGQFGISSDVYKRANNQVAVQLNSQPVSLTVGSNEGQGTISYNLTFNNRPTNIVSGVLSESFTVNDTYPGDVFAVIPVLGRPTGPVLQYIGGRTEYRRDVALNLIMDYTKIPYGSGRPSLILKKPSLVEPTATQISDLLKELSPQGEPGVRKYFVSPPTENWEPKTGTYSFNVSFTYEMDK